MAAPKGNRFAAKAKTWEGAIRRAINEDRSALHAIAQKVLAEAKAGEPWAITELRNTLDGKPTEHVKIDQTVEHVTTYGDYLAGKARPAAPAREPDPTVQ
jgi:hypothetical protein